jgi:hypothetical protein
MRMSGDTNVGEGLMSKQNRTLVLRALTDAKFRRQLQSDPVTALGKGKLTQTQQQEVNLVLALVKGIEKQITGVADQLLCVNGGGCRGIA